MRECVYFKNMVLVVEVWAVCLAVVILRAFCPGIVLPPISIPMMTLFSVIPMILSGLIRYELEEKRMVSVLLAGFTFVYLPFAVRWSTEIPFWKLFIAGIVVYGIAEVLYTSILTRIRSGAASLLAMVVSGLMLWLASQCFQGML